MRKKFLLCDHQQVEPYEGRLSRTVPWEGGGAIPLPDPIRHYYNNMREIGLFFTLLLVASCSSRQLLLEDIASQTFQFDIQKVSYPNNEFTLYIPIGWDWKIENYENENSILGIDIASLPDKEGYIDLISIQKVNSFGGAKDLESEYEYLLDLAKNQANNMILVESGETKLFKQKSYYIHTKSETGTYGESEILSFILEGDTKGTFYYLNASASQTKDFRKNMAILIQSLRTFEHD